MVYFVLCVLVGFGLHCLPRSKAKLEMRRRCPGGEQSWSHVPSRFDYPLVIWY